MAEILIEAGADVNFVEEVDGVTPLHLASLEGRFGIRLNLAMANCIYKFIFKHIRSR